MKNLVVVESPSKIKKIKGFLGTDFDVVSSVGHIRDLPKSSFGVDFDHDYEPAYEISQDKVDVVRDLKRKAKESDVIYLATDEDREGEAIAWHVGFVMNNNSYLKESAEGSDFLMANKIKNKNGISPKVYRVTFNSITKAAVLEAFKTPRKLDQHLVDAQQARRILDRLVGYKLSPVLWEKIRYGLSAGRVQSVAVRFIVEREREIKSFESNPYYELEAQFKANKDEFNSLLMKINEKSIYLKKEYELFAGKYSTSLTQIDNEDKASKIKADIETQKFVVKDIAKKESKSHPSAPFSTSSMQQSASTNLGYSPQRTMQLAQKLYEGGFITYMRTDSVHIEPSIVGDIRTYVQNEYGSKYLNSSVRVFSSKKEVKTQEAHEAIRPSDIKVKPNQLPKSVNPQQQKLYELIWARTIATQMSPAVYENAKVVIENPVGDTKYTFEVSGSIRKFDGFLKVLTSGKKDILLPNLSQGEDVDLKNLSILPNQITPPPRYNESSLVKALENFGIGRPSTYASIVSTIQTRGYVQKEDNKSLTPTDNGTVVNDLLVKHFPVVVDVHFTSHMEDDLDNVAIGKKSWVELLKGFYPDFAKLVEQKRKEIKKEDVVVLEKTDKICPECGKGHLEVKLGKYGRFYSCDQFPECKYMEGLVELAEGGTADEGELAPANEALAADLAVPCPECGGKLILKVGRFGKFIACENYPKCKFTKQILNKIGMKCPECGEKHDGEMISKKTRKGRLFYACSRYPDCKFASWTNPMVNLEKAMSEAAASAQSAKGKAAKDVPASTTSKAKSTKAKPRKKKA